LKNSEQFDLIRELKFLKFAFLDHKQPNTYGRNSQKKGPGLKVMKEVLTHNAPIKAVY
jgi:hypothetical protein